MNTELVVHLRGPQASADARHALYTVEHLVKILSQVERLGRVGGPRRGSKTSSWTFTELALGSLTATLAPLEVRGGSTRADLHSAMDLVVEGFRTAETEGVLPDAWTFEVANTAADAVKYLGADADHGMCLAVRVAGVAAEPVEVTSQSKEHLRKALRTHHTSVGSLRGHLGSVSDHPKRCAVLWDEVDQSKVTVAFRPDQMEGIRSAWGRDRVEVHGLIEENARGRILRVVMDDLEILPDGSSLRRADLRGGFYRGMTGGLDAVEHLAELRVEA